MITKYKLFLESRMSDIVKIIGEDDTIEKEINNYFNIDIEKDKKLIDKIFIPKSNKTIKIDWYNTIEHYIIKKIKDRTSLKSVEEFNELIEKTLIELFNNYFKNIYYANNRKIINKIAVKVRNIELYIILTYIPEKLVDEDTEIHIISIVQNIDRKTVNNVYNLENEEIY